MRDVAQMTWALGVLEQPELPFLAACQQGVTGRMRKVSAVDATNLLWGYARLRAPPAPPAMYTHIVRTPFPSSPVAGGHQRWSQAPSGILHSGVPGLSLSSCADAHLLNSWDGQ